MKRRDFIKGALSGLGLAVIPPFIPNILPMDPVSPNPPLFPLKDLAEASKSISMSTGYQPNIIMVISERAYQTFLEAGIDLNKNDQNVEVKII